MEEPKRLYRSNNGMIAGVCAGICRLFRLGSYVSAHRIYIIEYLYDVFRGDRLPDPLDGYTETI